MANPNPKLIDLDFGTSERVGSPSSPIIPMPALGPEGGAATEVRLLVDQLQQAAWEARARLRAVEEERNSLSSRLEEAQAAQHELLNRLSQSGNAAQDRDAALREAQLSARVANESHSRALAAEKAASDLQRQCEELVRQRDEFRRAFEGASRQTSAQSGAPNDFATQLFNLRQARDSAQAQSRALSDKLAAAQEELLDLQDQLDSNSASASPEGSLNAAEAAALRETNSRLEAEIGALREEGAASKLAIEQNGMEITALQQQREEVLLQLEIVSKEVMALRQEAEQRQGDVATLSEQGAEASRRLAELTDTMEPLRQEVEKANAERAEALARLEEAESKRQEISREKEEILSRVEEQGAVIESLRGQISSQEVASARALRESLNEAEREIREQTERLQAQRLETIDLVARLETAQREIKIMSANLAEARLMAKASGARVEEAKELREAKQVAAAPQVSEVAILAPQHADLVPTGEFDSESALESLRGMRRCYQDFIKGKDDLSHLNELYCFAHGIAERASAAGLPGLHRIVSAFGAFVQELYQFPEQISEQTLKTVHDTQEFLCSLMKLKNLSQLHDSSTRTVYIVEDDELTCECITMVMEAAMMRGVSSSDPLKAACELASTPCDLIFLDIRMPGMDGFELCTEIRNVALHRDTPIIFLSGDDCPENRAKATLVGGCDFLTKPFIFCELTLKALVHIARAQFHIA